MGSFGQWFPNNGVRVGGDGQEARLQLCHLPVPLSLLSHTVKGGILLHGGKERVHGSRNARLALKEEVFAK